MAVWLDTSVMPRLLIGEPRVQMEVARRRIESALIAGERVVVTDLVLDGRPPRQRAMNFLQSDQLL